MEKAVIIGATSGIGRELAKVLSREGYALGLTGRRIELLHSLQDELPTAAHVARMDVSRPDAAIRQLEQLIERMGGMDLLVISAGVGFINTDMAWEQERDTIATNVTGFSALAGAGIRHFIRQSSGHLVAISSVAALRGNGAAPAYNASKAFVSNYMEGLRHKVARLKLPVAVTDVRPGFVDTAMARGDRLFWVASPEKAARQIHLAIRRKRPHAFVTRRWRIVGWLLKVLPDWIYHRL